MKVHRLTVDLRRVRAGWSAVGETGIPGVTVECVDIDFGNENACVIGGGVNCRLLRIQF